MDQARNTLKRVVRVACGNVDVSPAVPNADRSPSVGRPIFLVHESPLSEVIRHARADPKVVLVAVHLVVKGRHEVVGLRNAKCDGAA